MKTIRKEKHVQWLVPSSAAKSPEELSFTEAGAAGFKWWDVTPPKTPYTQAHDMLGRALAFELLDYLRNPAADKTPEALGHIALGIMGERVDTCRGQMLMGFFGTISTFVSGEPVNR